MNIDQVKINSDLGEGIGIEKDIMPYLRSCSIACGGHTGDKSTMKNTILIAKKILQKKKYYRIQKIF